MQRDKKLLLLSLSHDIKTPLSAIKLNAKALAKGSIQGRGKTPQAAESINTRADEIEHFVSEITKAASEDFMSFEVTQGEAFPESDHRKDLFKICPSTQSFGNGICDRKIR